MDPLLAAAATIGLNVASNAIYDAAKSRLLRGPATKKDIAQEIKRAVPEINIQGAELLAETVIDFFASQGHITVQGSQIYARDSVWMRSTLGTKMHFGEGSVSSTDRTRITTTQNGRITATGGGQVRQNPDGSISIGFDGSDPNGQVSFGFRGNDPNDHISFGTKK